AGDGVGLKLDSPLGFKSLNGVHQAKNAVAYQIVGVDGGRQTDGHAPGHVLDQGRVVDDELLPGRLAPVGAVLRPQLIDLRPARLHSRHPFQTKLDLPPEREANHRVPVPLIDLRKFNSCHPLPALALFQLLDPADNRSEEHTLNSSHVKSSYAVFSL